MSANQLPTIGQIVHFFPPSECAGPIRMYAAIVTQTNLDCTLELATFGPNSLYFQHNVPKFGDDCAMTPEHPEGKWSWGWSLLQ
jgi:hypothetical protein